MSHSVTVLLSFVVARANRLPALAREHAHRLHAIDNDVTRDSDLESFKRMLDEVAEGRCVGTGRNGDMFSYGFVGNYTSIDTVTEHLGGFIAAIFSEGIVRRNNAVMVLLQNEQHREIEAFEISVPWEGSWSAPLPTYTVNDLQVRGRLQSFPAWCSTSEEPVSWFNSTPLRGTWQE